MMFHGTSPRSRHCQNTGAILAELTADIGLLDSITPQAPPQRRRVQRQSTALLWLLRQAQISAMPNGGEGGCPVGPALTRARSFKPAPFPRPSRAWPSCISIVKGRYFLASPHPSSVRCCRLGAYRVTLAAYWSLHKPTHHTLCSIHRMSKAAGCTAAWVLAGR
jgi:hypothetical protein